jgi:ADP-ribosylglycohydrolase
MKMASPSTADVVAVTGTTGYAASVIPFAISLAAVTGDLSKTLTDIVRSGGDTDTAGAIVGSIYGVRLGDRGLAANLADGVKSMPMVRDIATRYADIVERRRNQRLHADAHTCRPPFGRPPSRVPG